MKVRYLLVFLVLFSIMFPFTGVLESKKGSDAGIPRDIDDLYNLSSLIVRGSFIDLNPGSDLIQVQVDEVYKGKCGEYVSIRRLDLEALGQVDDDCVIFLSPFDKIYKLTWGMCNVYPIEDGVIYRGFEQKSKYNTLFDVDGMPLTEFIEKYLA